MYRYKKAGKQKLKNACLIFVIIVLTAVSSIFFYKMYEGIQINTYQTQGTKNSIYSRRIKKSGKTNCRYSRRCNILCSWNF